MRKKLNSAKSGVDFQQLISPHAFTGHHVVIINPVELNILIGGRKMKIWQSAVRVLGILVGLLFLADLFRSSFDWQNTAVRLAISLPLLVPWSLLRKRWTQAIVYFLLWADLLLCFILVISFFIFERAFGADVYPASIAIGGLVVFLVCVPSLFLMRRTFSRSSGEPIQAPQQQRP